MIKLRNSNRKSFLFFVILLVLIAFVPQSVQSKTLSSGKVTLTHRNFYYLDQFTLNQENEIKLEIRIKSEIYEEEWFDRIDFFIFRSEFYSSWITYLDENYPYSPFPPPSTWSANPDGYEFQQNLILGPDNYTLCFALDVMIELKLSFSLIQMDWFNYHWKMVVLICVILGVLSIAAVIGYLGYKGKLKGILINFGNNLKVFSIQFAKFIFAKDYNNTFVVMIPPFIFTMLSVFLLLMDIHHWSNGILASLFFGPFLGLYIIGLVIAFFIWIIIKQSIEKEENIMSAKQILLICFSCFLIIPGIVYLNIALNNPLSDLKEMNDEKRKIVVASMVTYLAINILGWLWVLIFYILASN